jgi:hypothetical protein
MQDPLGLTKLYIRVDRTGELIPMTWNPETGAWESPKNAFDYSEPVSVVMHLDPKEEE